MKDSEGGVTEAERQDKFSSSKLLVKEQIIRLKDLGGRVVEAEGEIREELNLKFHSVFIVKDILTSKLMR